MSMDSEIRHNTSKMYVLTSTALWSKTKLCCLGSTDRCKWTFGHKDSDWQHNSTICTYQFAFNCCHLIWFQFLEIWDITTDWDLSLLHEVCKGFPSRILKPSSQSCFAVQMSFSYLEYEDCLLGVWPITFQKLWQNENCALLGYYAANSGNSVLHFGTARWPHLQGSRLQEAVSNTITFHVRVSNVYLTCGISVQVVTLQHRTRDLGLQWPDT